MSRGKDDRLWECNQNVLYPDLVLFKNIFPSCPIGVVGVVLPGKFARLLLGQGTCLGCMFGLQLGYIQEANNQCFSLSLMFLSHS